MISCDEFKGLFSCTDSFLVFLTEVLLDMRATGGELGWLTWPLDQGDKPGVSIAPASPPAPPAPTFPLGICLRINLHGENAHEGPSQTESLWCKNI